jgi:predicted DNA-binding ribbon-helix-helix protein
MDRPKKSRKSLVVKRSIIIDGHKTSVSLEDDFWGALQEISAAQGVRVSELVTTISHGGEHANLFFCYSLVRSGLLSSAGSREIGPPMTLGNDAQRVGALGANEWRQPSLAPHVCSVSGPRPCLPSCGIGLATWN